jgi:peptidoglycan/xylan/chitin deacetylase (PgdA/CDA1 family)
MPRLRLAGAAALAELSANAFAVGSHGMTHTPLGAAEPSELQREVVDSRSVLEQAIGTEVRWFAYPYGSVPRGSGRALVERTYAGAAVLGNRALRGGDDLWAITRIDAHYVRRPALLARVLAGGDRYLTVRRAGARLRRLVDPDYVSV